MSIINDALKKAQESLKKNGKGGKNEESQEKEKPESEKEKPAPEKDEPGDSKSNSDVTGIYEKMYKKDEPAGEEEKKKPPASGSGSGSKSTGTKETAEKSDFPLIPVIIICLAVAGGAALYLWKNPSVNILSGFSNGSVAKPAPPREFKPGETVLVGVMTTDGESSALINNDIYEVGDLVDGKKVINITEDSVDLLDGEQIITLRLK